MWPKVWRRIPKKKKKTPRCINSYCLLSLYKLCSCSNGFLANSEWCGASAVPNWPCDYLKEASLTLSIPVWYKDRKWCQGEFGLSVCHIESGTTHKYSMNSRVHADFFFFCRLLGRLVNASSCVVPRSATPYTLCLCGHVLLSQAFLLCLQEGKELMDLLIHLFTSWPSPLLLFFSLSPLTLTCILPTVWDLTANKPTISPSRGVIWHLAGMGAVHAEHRQDVCMFQTPFLCGPEGFRGIRVEVREMEGRWTDNEKLVLSGEGQRENKKEKVKVQGCLLVVCVCKYTCTIHTLVPVWSTRKFNLASKQRIDCHWLYHASTSKKRLQINI